MTEELHPTTPPAGDPPDPPKTSSHCPECGCEFDGISVTHASETLTALREENSALKQEIAAEKQKRPEPVPQPAPAPVPRPTPEPAAKKRGYLHGKRAAS